MRSLLLVLVFSLSLPTPSSSQVTGTDVATVTILTALVAGGVASGVHIKKNSIKKKELIDVDILCQNRLLKEVKSGRKYKIQIRAIDNEQKEYLCSSYPDKKGNTPFRDWIIDVKGGEITYYRKELKVYENPDTTVNEVLLTLTSRFDSTVSYQFSFPIIRPIRLSIQTINQHTNTYIPNGSIDIAGFYSFENAMYDERVRLNKRLFDIQIKGGTLLYGRKIEVAPPPFGLNGNDSILISYAEKEGPLKGKHAIPLTYKGDLIYYTGGYHGADGNHGRNGDSTNRGEDGTSGSSGFDAPQLKIKMDLYTAPNHKKLILIQIVSTPTETKTSTILTQDTLYFLGDPKYSTLTINNNGGNGGDGGSGGDGKPKGTGRILSSWDYCGRDAGSGGNGGNGGPIKLQISPEAAALNFPLKLTNKGGFAGKKGYGGDGTGLTKDGEDGVDGQNGKDGPPVLKEIKEVEIILAK